MLDRELRTSAADDNLVLDTPVKDSSGGKSIEWFSSIPLLARERALIRILTSSRSGCESSSSRVKVVGLSALLLHTAQLVANQPVRLCQRCCRGRHMRFRNAGERASRDAGRGRARGVRSGAGYSSYRLEFVHREASVHRENTRQSIADAQRVADDVLNCQAASIQ